VGARDGNVAGRVGEEGELGGGVGIGAWGGNDTGGVGEEGLSGF
jgi:hypothetical protein